MHRTHSELLSVETHSYSHCTVSSCQVLTKVEGGRGLMTREPAISFSKVRGWETNITRQWKAPPSRNNSIKQAPLSQTIGRLGYTSSWSHPFNRSSIISHRAWASTVLDGAFKAVVLEFGLCQFWESGPQTGLSFLVIRIWAPQWPKS